MMELRKTTAVITDLLTVEEAETLLEWLQKHPRGKLDLAGCTHLHTANLQVLMAARPQISAWPENETLAAWLRAALCSQE